MAIIDLFYLFFATLALLLFIRQSENKFLNGLLIGWMLYSPVLDRPEYVLSTPFGFDLQPSRVLFILIALYLSIKIFNISKFNPSKPSPLYEKFLFLYLVIATIVLVLNRNLNGVTKSVAYWSSIITFGLLYLAISKYSFKKDFKVFCQAVFTLAVFSAFVGLIQFFIDPAFFKIESARLAFGDYYRPSGVFPSEYNQGFFMIIAFILALFYKEKYNASRLFLVSMIMVCVPSVFLTMHRLSWGILVAVIVAYYFLHAKRIRFQEIFVISMVVLVIIGVFRLPWDQILPNDIFQGLLNRTIDDTLSGRIEYYQFSLDLIRNFPVGIGSYYNDLYGQLAFNAGLPFQTIDGVATPLVIHNGFLSTGVKFGIAGAIAFLGFLALTLLYYLPKNRLSGSSIKLISFLIVLTFIGYNLTNDFSDFSSPSNILFGALLGFLLIQFQANASDTAAPVLAH